MNKEYSEAQTWALLSVRYIEDHLNWNDNLHILPQKKIFMILLYNFVNNLWSWNNSKIASQKKIFKIFKSNLEQGKSNLGMALIQNSHKSEFYLRERPYFFISAQHVTINICTMPNRCIFTHNFDLQKKLLNNLKYPHIYHPLTFCYIKFVCSVLNICFNNVWQLIYLFKKDI